MNSVENLSSLINKYVFTVLIAGEHLISVSIDQRLAVWQLQLQDKTAAEIIRPDSSAGTTDNVQSPPAGILLPAADNSAACVLKSVRCSSVADIQDTAFFAAHHEQEQFVICVGIGLEIFRLKI
jgi:hypothetical protein